MRNKGTVESALHRRRNGSVSLGEALVCSIDDLIFVIYCLKNRYMFVLLVIKGEVLKNIYFKYNSLQNKSKYILSITHLQNKSKYNC